jgi:hypothetical protein
MSAISFVVQSKHRDAGDADNKEMVTEASSGLTAV